MDEVVKDMNNDEHDVDVVPESPPLSQVESESQQELFTKLTMQVTTTTTAGSSKSTSTNRDKEEEEPIYEIVDEDSSSNESWDNRKQKALDIYNQDDDDLVIIDDDDDERLKPPSQHCIIDMDDMITDEVEELLKTINNKSAPSTSTFTTTGAECKMDEDDDLSFLQDVERLEQESMIQGQVASSSTSGEQGLHGGDGFMESVVVSNRTEDERKEEVRRMKRLDPMERIFPDVKANGFHTVAFFLSNDYKHGDDLKPHPTEFQSKWENDYVPLPCARQNTRLFKIRVQSQAENQNNADERVRFREEKIWMWRRIEGALRVPILLCSDFAEALKQYINFKTELKALNYCLESVMSDTERYNFFSKVLPCMQTLCLDLERMVTCPLPLLIKFKNQSISLSQKQIACLLANAFFCTFPKRFSDDELRFPTINFLELFQCQEDDDTNSRLITKAQKIRCILNYFERIAESMPLGVVTFTRKSIRNVAAPKWDTLTRKLSKIIPLLDGTIEDDGVGMLQVDFANKFVGGGVLGRGTVQEEILFSIYPELIVSRLFTEKLTSCEALIVTGCERFSRYSGYASSFTFQGDFTDVTPVGPKGRRCNQFVAIDALFITRPLEQFHTKFLIRELNKAYVGFSSPTATAVPVATGKWGCGAFNGNPQLKAILQLLAASQAGRDVVFFTFGDIKIQKEIEEMYETIRNCTIQQVWQLLCHYYRLFCSTTQPKYDLCQYIVRYANGDDSTGAPTANTQNLKNNKLTPPPITSSCFYGNDRDPPSTYEELFSNVNGVSNSVKPKISKIPFSKSTTNEGSKILTGNESLTENQITDLLFMDENSQQDEDVMLIEEEVQIIPGPGPFPSSSRQIRSNTESESHIGVKQNGLTSPNRFTSSLTNTSNSPALTTKKETRQTSLTDFYK